MTIHPSASSFSLPGAVQSWEFEALTDAGRVRANNEDAIAVDPALGFALLADGMGGYNGGEVASGMAIALLRASFGRWLSHSGSRAPARSVCLALQVGTDEANSAILEAGSANPSLQGMGTTLVLAVLGPHRAIVGHIGDSRCYRLRTGRLEQLTRDHSLMQDQLDAGLITPQQAALSPHRNLVTRALGIERAVELEVNEFPVETGDLFLLCSDGLSEMISDNEILQILLQTDTLAKKAALLVAAANDNGGRDNISVVLAHALGSGTASGAS